MYTLLMFLDAQQSQVGCLAPQSKQQAKMLQNCKEDIDFFISEEYLKVYDVYRMLCVVFHLPRILGRLPKDMEIKKNGVVVVVKSKHAFQSN